MQLIMFTTVSQVGKLPQNHSPKRSLAIASRLSSVFTYFKEKEHI